MISLCATNRECISSFKSPYNYQNEPNEYHRWELLDVFGLMSNRHQTSKYNTISKIWSKNSSKPYSPIKNKTLVLAGKKYKKMHGELGLTSWQQIIREIKKRKKED